jgi:predicted site-specific integrase-resolvase
VTAPAEEFVIPGSPTYGPEKYLNRQTFEPGELARICRVHPETLVDWANAGMPHLKTLGGHRRYRRSQLPFLPPAGDPQLVTFTDIALVAGVSVRTVHRWADARRFDWVRLPSGNRRASRTAAAEFVAKRRAERS